MFTYTCIRCGKIKHHTQASRIMIARGLELKCATCCRRIREDRAEIKRGLNEAV